MPDGRKILAEPLPGVRVVYRKVDDPAFPHEVSLSFDKTASDAAVRRGLRLLADSAALAALGPDDYRSERTAAVRLRSEGHAAIFVLDLA